MAIYMNGMQMKLLTGLCGDNQAKIFLTGIRMEGDFSRGVDRNGLFPAPM